MTSMKDTADAIAEPMTRNFLFSKEKVSSLGSPVTGDLILRPLNRFLAGAYLNFFFKSSILDPAMN